MKNAIIIVLLFAGVALAGPKFCDQAPDGTRQNIRSKGCPNLPGECDCNGPHWDPAPGTTRHVLTAEELEAIETENAEGARRAAVDRLLSLQERASVMRALYASAGAERPKIRARLASRIATIEAERDNLLDVIEAALP